MRPTRRDYRNFTSIAIYNQISFSFGIFRYLYIYIYKCIQDLLLIKLSKIKFQFAMFEQRFPMTVFSGSQHDIMSEEYLGNRSLGLFNIHTS